MCVCVCRYCKYYNSSTLCVYLYKQHCPVMSGFALLYSRLVLVDKVFLQIFQVCYDIKHS